MHKEDALRRRGERLRDAAGAIGIMRLAKDAGVPYTTLRDYMAGGDMKLSIVAQLARACGVTIDWIAHGTEADTKVTGPSASEEEPRSSRTPIDLAWLSLRLGIVAGELVAFDAVGDAMAPVIRDGDLLVARRLERAVIAPAVYAIEVDGGLVARRLEQRVDGALVVRTDNPRYDPQILSPAEEKPFRIIGPVVWQSGPIRG